MNRADKIKDKSRQAIGYLKFKLGNRRTQAAGGKDMASGKASEARHKATHAVKRRTHRDRPPKDEPEKR